MDFEHGLQVHKRIIDVIKARDETAAAEWAGTNWDSFPEKK